MELTSKQRAQLRGVANGIDIASRPLRQFPAGFPGRQKRVFQHLALDNFPGLQRVVGLLDQIVRDTIQGFTPPDTAVRSWMTRAVTACSWQTCGAQPAARPILPAVLISLQNHFDPMRGENSLHLLKFVRTGS